MAATEIRSVDFALKNGIAADLYVDTSHLGRFVIEEETLISGGDRFRPFRPDCPLSEKREGLVSFFIITVD